MGTLYGGCLRLDWRPAGFEDNSKIQTAIYPSDFPGFPVGRRLHVSGLPRSSLCLNSELLWERIILWPNSAWRPFSKVETTEDSEAVRETFQQTAAETHLRFNGGQRHAKGVLWCRTARVYSCLTTVRPTPNSVSHWSWNNSL